MEADYTNRQEVHISSGRMPCQSQLGCVAERTEDTIQRWFEKFRKVLHDVIDSATRNERYMEEIRATFQLSTTYRPLRALTM